MRRIASQRASKAPLILAALVIAIISALPLSARPRKHKDKDKGEAAANDVTSRLYQIADQSLEGKFSFYLLAGVYTDPAKPGVQYQRVLRVVYDKDLYFGRFAIHVRSVSKLTPDQLAAYTPEDIFNYGNADTAEFEKISPGRFGRTGDLYLASSNGGPLAAASITPEVQSEYEKLVTDYILPEVEKLAGQKQ